MKNSRVIQISPDRVKEEAKKKGVSINQLAIYSETGKSSDSKIRALRRTLNPNENKLCSINEEVLDKIARRLNISRDYLAGMSPEDFYAKEEKYGFCLADDHKNIISSSDHVPTYLEQIYLDYCVNIEGTISDLLKLFGAENWHWKRGSMDEAFNGRLVLIAGQIRNAVMKGFASYIINDDYSKYLSGLAVTVIQYSVEFHAAQDGYIDGFDDNGNKVRFPLNSEEEKTAAINEWIRQSVIENKHNYETNHKRDELMTFDSTEDFINAWKKAAGSAQKEGK